MKAHSPCYLWWPKDILADPMVAALTLEQEGAYRRLLDWAWLDEGIESDAETIAALCKIDTSTDEGRARAEGLRKRLAPFFDQCPRTGRWTHTRMEKAREEQLAKLDAKARAGRASAAARRASRQRKGNADASSGEQKVNGGRTAK